VSSHYRAYHLVRHVRALRVGSIEASYANPPAQRAHQVRLSMKGAPALRGQLGSPCRCGCPDMCTDGHFHLRSSGSMGRGRHSRRGRITTSCLRVRAPLRMMLGAPNRERSANFSFFFLLNSCIFLLNLGAVSRCRRQIGGALLPVVPAKQIGSFSCDTLRRPTTAPLYLCSTWCVDFPGIRRSAVFFMG
jgi:hypothetical protein